MTSPYFRIPDLNRAQQAKDALLQPELEVIERGIKKISDETMGKTVLHEFKSAGDGCDIGGTSFHPCGFVLHSPQIQAEERLKGRRR
jgi:hypothetical protein